MIRKYHNHKPQTTPWHREEEPPNHYETPGTPGCTLLNLPSHAPMFFLTLKAPTAIKVVCFSRLLKCLRSPYGKQCGTRSDCSYGTVCSGSLLFASILNSSVIIGNYLQQTTSADNIFRCNFFLGALRVKIIGAIGTRL